MDNSSISFIGAGHMSTYIIKGLIASGFSASKITATRRSEAPLKHLKKKYNINTTTDIKSAAKTANVIILGVKPLSIQEVLLELKSTIQKTKPLIISIAAGITVEKISSCAGDELPVIRTMPNLPVAVKCGTTCIYASKNVSTEQKLYADKLFTHLGVTCWLEEEHYMDIAILVGSGPALFYRFIQALKTSVISMGLDEKTANKLVVNTGLGALKLLDKSGDSPEKLKEHVTSPGGTTQAALNILESNNLDSIIHKSIKAAVEKSQELSNKF